LGPEALQAVNPRLVVLRTTGFGQFGPYATRRPFGMLAALRFFGKSAVHPRQLPILHEVFTSSADEIAWAQTVLDAFERRPAP
jgi:hypothetical protein